MGCAVQWRCLAPVLASVRPWVCVAKQLLVMKLFLSMILRGQARFEDEVGPMSPILARNVDDICRNF